MFAYNKNVDRYPEPCKTCRIFLEIEQASALVEQAFRIHMEHEHGLMC